MGQFATTVTNERTISVFNWIAKLAAYPQRSWVIVIAGAAAATIIAELLLRLQYTRLTGIALRIVGLLSLMFGLFLLYVRFWVPAVRVPSAASVWIPSAGVLLLVAAWAWQRRRARLARDRTRRIVDVAAVRIMALEQEHGTPNFVDQLTISDEPVLPLIRSIMGGKRKRKLVAISGPSGSGKTVTLLRYGASCLGTRTSRHRPIVPIYVDLDAYAAKFTENPALEDFIQGNFIKNESSDLDVEKAWKSSGHYVEWIFLFDNADEANLRQADQAWSRQIVENFLKRYARSNSFRALMATYVSKDSSIDSVIELGSLTDDGWREFLGKAGINRSAVDVIAADEGLYWFLRDPSAIKLLTPVLVGRPWVTGDNVHEALREAINGVSNSSAQTQAFRTAIAAIRFLMRTPEGYYADAPVNLAKKLADIGSIISLSAQEIDSDLTILAECGALKRVRTRTGDYIEFTPAFAAYFYSCALLEGLDQISIEKLLHDQRLRLTAISLLQAADNEYIAKFLRKVDSILDPAIYELNEDQLKLLKEQIDVFRKAKRTEPLKRAESLLADRYNQARDTNGALFILVGGLQNRLELLSEDLHQKIIKFTKLVMPLCGPRTQAHVLAIRYVFEPPSDDVIKPDPGLTSRNGQVILDTTSRIVNSLSETTGLPEADRGRLVAVVLLAGLGSLTLTRGRGTLPASIRIANDAGNAMLVLYGIVFFGGAGLQLITYPHRSPFFQICEVIIAMLVALPLYASRALPSWRLRLLSIDFYSLMKVLSSLLAFIGSVWLFFVLLIDLATFNIAVMPILACYILMWPAYVGFYLAYTSVPSVTNAIFPSPGIAQDIWRRLYSLFKSN